MIQKVIQFQASSTSPRVFSATGFLDLVRGIYAQRRLSGKLTTELLQGHFAMTYTGEADWSFLTPDEVSTLKSRVGDAKFIIVTTADSSLVGIERFLDSSYQYRFKGRSQHFPLTNQCRRRRHCVLAASPTLLSSSFLSVLFL